MLEYCSQWNNRQQTTVPGIGYIQDDVPDEIGAGNDNCYKELSQSVSDLYGHSITQNFSRT